MADIKKMIENFTFRGFSMEFFENKNDAVKWIIAQISPGTIVGIPGSETVKELNISSLAKEKQAIVWEHGTPGLTKEEKHSARLMEGRCDVLITSANAITENGCVVNCDGRGNRVAAQIFGPPKVIAVAGINKICANVDEAMERIQKIAGPLNSKRLNLTENPCYHTGVCADCNSYTRVCRAYTIVKKPLMGQNYIIVLINENLGF